MNSVYVTDKRPAQVVVYPTPNNMQGLDKRNYYRPSCASCYHGRNSMMMIQPTIEPIYRQPIGYFDGEGPPPRPDYRSTFVGEMILSCIVFFLCGQIFGAIAFILAVAGKSSLEVGDERSTRCYSIASLTMSIVGIIIGIIVLSICASFYWSYL